MNKMGNFCHVSSLLIAVGCGDLLSVPLVPKARSFGVVDGRIDVVTEYRPIQTNPF